MSEQHSSEHESLIKTPKQLIIVILLSFIIPIVIAILFSQLATSGRKSGDKVSEEKITQLIQPVARVELAAAGGAAKAAKTSEQIVQAACAACHLSGAAGAPKIGDKAAWAPRLGLGLEGLTQSVITGKGAMPPKGGAADLSEADIARAIAFMANQSGANFKEPAASPVASPAAKAEAPAVPAPAASSPAVAPAAPAAAVKPAEKAAAKPEASAAAADVPKPSDDGKKQEALDLILETIEALGTERGEDEKIWGSMVKQALKRRKPGFNEAYYGFRSFNKLLEEAEARHMLKLERDEKSGGYIIRQIDI